MTCTEVSWGLMWRSPIVRSRALEIRHTAQCLQIASASHTDAPSNIGSTSTRTTFHAPPPTPKRLLPLTGSSTSSGTVSAASGMEPDRDGISRARYPGSWSSHCGVTPSSSTEANSTPTCHSPSLSRLAALRALALCCPASGCMKWCS